MAARILRLSDLAQRRQRERLVLLSVRIPVSLIERVDRLVHRLGRGKAEVVVALLNEGLARNRSAVARKRP